MSVEVEKSEILRRGIPFGRIGELASTADSTVWATDVSSLYAGRSVASDKATRIRAAAAKLIDLYDSVLVKPNWRSPRNVRTALAKLAEIREAGVKTDEKGGAQPATAPWSSRNAVASRDESTGAVSSAFERLSGASESNS